MQRDMVRSWRLTQFVGVLVALFLGNAAAQGDAKTDDGNMLLLGVRADAPPFSWRHTDGSYKGYSVELCERIAKRAIERGLYCGYRFREVTAANRFELLRNNHIQMLCGATSVTQERMRVADFSLFTFVSGTSVMYRKFGGEFGASNKRTLTIGVLRGTTTNDDVTHIVNVFRGNTNDAQTIRIRRTTDHFQGLEKLRRGEFDAYLADREILLALNQFQNDSTTTATDQVDIPLAVSAQYFTTEPYALGLTAGVSELRYVANSLLSNLYDIDRLGKENIFDVLKRYFRGKRFSKGLEDLFRIQRLPMGEALIAPPAKVSCP